MTMMRSIAELESTAATVASSPVAQRSPWHSPVPYLFGGLAAMLGLIAFALLILACSYWKLSGYLENNEDNERDLEAGEDDSKGGDMKTAPPVFEEKFVVIMAGQEKPTYLATLMSSRDSSFGTNTISTCSCSTESEKSEEKTKENLSGELEMSTSTMETHDDVTADDHIN